ncbi:nonribosomal peptide synthase [Penicillium mononematosum]|uniref:nonribosomal peptide synthase n=1 Tax=Penicillium mononematosum TaxID=268346 RepID=UPI0025488803|nr:nonribosomal peptide synthase [Penicillium mononematosum]KAJ6186272.1 nonribosomal peptide synthase [Penicillium mononematosum]
MLAETMTRMQVTWAILTPTVLGALHPDELPYLQHLGIAGEPLGESDIQTWFSKLHLFQAYGFTEWAGICTVSPQITSVNQRRVIGAPANARLWVVEPGDHNRLSPIGAVGELVVQGPSLARGYLADKTRTDLVFVERPSWMSEFPCGDCGPIYKTGDLVRYNEDGTLSYMQRKDNQVKLRGQRLEIEEVEYHTRQVAARAERVIAMIYEPQNMAVQQRTLIALIVMSQSNRTTFTRGKLNFLDLRRKDEDEIRRIERELPSRLPNFMLPQLLLPVCGVPATITGKLDRRAIIREVNGLPFDELRRLAGLAVESQRPESRFERLILEQVSEVLDLKPDDVGMLDNFFHLGGDSASAVKLVAKAKRLGLRLQVLDIFKKPILRDLASIVKEVVAQSDSVSIQPMELLSLPAANEIRKLAMADCDIEDDQIEDIYPCTPLQEGLLATSSKNPHMFKAQFVCELKPGVDVALFKEAWEQVVESNDILRTRFVTHPGYGTLQVVVKEPCRWSKADDLEACLHHAHLQPAGMGNKLVNAYLLPSQTGSAPVTFVVIMHHALCDRWSFDLILEQIAMTYKKQGTSGRQNHFSPFIKYILEQSKYFSQYWEKQFEGVGATSFPVLPHPTHQPAATEQFRQTINIPTDRTMDHTLSTCIRLAWAIVISLNTSTADVVFGITVNGRAANVDYIEQMIGPTIATIPLHVRLNFKATLRDALARLEAKAIEMIPFEQAGLQTIRKISAEARQACNFQSQLIVQSNSRKRQTLFDGCQYSSTTLGGFANYALSVECLPNDNGTKLDITVLVDTKAISSRRARSLVLHMAEILRKILQDPHQRLDDLPQIRPEEFGQLKEWNKVTPTDPPKCIHHLIDAQSSTAPHKPAVVAYDGQFTYADIERWSKRLGSWLLGKGLQPGDIIPLLFEKSKWTLVAMLGVLRARGTFVLLEHSHPLGRLQGVCKDTSASIVLCSRSFAQLAGNLAQIVGVIEEQGTFLEARDEPVFPIVQPDDAAYVVFTSGSTGKPKGVVIEHKSYCAGAQAHNQSHQVDSSSRVLQFASYSFDVSIVECLSTLIAGGCVCVLSEWERKNNVAQAAHRLGVTHAFLTPSFSRLLKHEQIPTLRVLIVGGETAAPSDCSYWADKVKLINEYGPAECSVAFCVQPYLNDQGTHHKDIGHPLVGAGWVVDPANHNRLLPIGAVGELLIEGPLVGRGYLNAPEMATNAFIEPPPWLKAIRGRHPWPVYKTGDLVQINDNGSFRFVDRHGTLTKLHGQRLELGEVESNILQCFPGATEAAAVVTNIEDRNRSLHLIAFIVVEGTATIRKDNSLLGLPTDDFKQNLLTARSVLKRILPSYMVPSVFLPITHMPRTGSGKLDRHKLKDEVARRPWADLQQYGTSIVQKRVPSTLAEKALRDIWANSLNITASSIGLDDSFTDLGGDSITAMQVVAQAQGKGMPCSFRDIIDFGTIAKIVGRTSNATNRCLESLPEEPETVFSLSPTQQYFFDKYRHSEIPNHFNQNIMVHLEERVPFTEVRKAAVNLVRCHAMLRCRFSRQGDGTWKQYIARNVESSFSFRLHQLSSSAEVQDHISSAHKGIHITDGPVFSVEMFEMGPYQSICLVGHHLVLDLVSWRIILADLDASIRGTLSDGGNLTSFQTWCGLQSRYGEEKLQPPPSLVTRRKVGMSQGLWSFWGIDKHIRNTFAESVGMSITIDEQTTAALLGPSNHRFSTAPEELLHAAILFAFIRTFPDRPIPIIWGKGHGREAWDRSIDLSRTVGWFNTMWPVEAQVDRASDLETIVQIVRDTRRQHPDHGWSYFTSVYHNTQRRSLAEKLPPVEITFNYAGRLNQQSSLLRLEPISKLELFNGSGNVERWGIFEINSLVINGHLEFHLAFPRRLKRDRVVCPWMNNFQSCLRALASLVTQVADKSLLTLADQTVPR